MCKALTLNNKTCSRNALKSGYCSQHDKDQKIAMYKKELAKMHARVRFYIEKTNKLNLMLNDIYWCDYIKTQLAEIGGSNRAYRYTISDLQYKDQLEALFDLPFDELLPYYFSLLDRRNRIVHKYSFSEWEPAAIPPKLKYQKTKLALSKKINALDRTINLSNIQPEAICSPVLTT